MTCLQVKHITVRKGAIDYELACPLSMLYVDEYVARRIKKLLPNIGKQVCVNGKGDFFADELVGTETPHLLEHIIIELLGMAYGKIFAGHTSWADELANTASSGYALMRVTVTFLDDLVALVAFNKALMLLEWTFAEDFENVISVQEIIDELHAMIHA